MPREEHHVVPDNGDWAVKRNGAERASKKFDTKREAENYAREQSIRHHTELIIHGRDGKIQRADSHGNDPCPPKDEN